MGLVFFANPIVQESSSLFTSRPAFVVTFSATIFATARGNLFHAIAIFPSGLILGWVYVAKSESLQQKVATGIMTYLREEFSRAAFWTTACVHILYNATSVATSCYL